jgi:hypothetical protein
MKKSVKILLISLGVIVAGVVGYFLVSSLSSNDADICNGDVLFPFQEKEDGDWGFIDFQGNEIISPEFKERPSLAKNGIFLLEQTKKDKRFFQFYRISDNKAKEIGDRWDTAHEFSDGLAAVVQENKYIQFINEDMKVVFTLDKIERAGNFFDGMVSIENSEGKWGFANKEGKIVIKPSYDEVSDFYDGKAVVTETKGKENEESNHFYVIDKNGEKLLNLKDKYSSVENATEGYFMVTETHDDEVEYGFIDITGEKIVKPKDYQNITTVHNGHFSYQEEGEWGLKNIEGEKILGAKYSEPLLVFNDIVWFKKEGEEDYGAMNIKGEEVIEEEYSSVFPFYCNTTFAMDGKDFVFIDKEGETINKMEYRNIQTEWESLIHPMYSHNSSYNNKYIASDYFDVSAYTEQVNIGEITRFLGKGVTSTQNYFGGNDDSNKKALVDNSNGYHYSEGIGEYNYYNGGYPRFKLYWNKSNMNFKWKEYKESKVKSEAKVAGSFSAQKLKDKNISNIYVNADFNDYLKTKTLSQKQASRMTKSDIKGAVRINTSAKLNKITITINIQNKGYGKTDKIAEAFGLELKKLIDNGNDEFKETKEDNSYYLYGTSEKMSVKVTEGYSSITIQLTKIDREVQTEMDASSYEEEVSEDAAAEM